MQSLLELYKTIEIQRSYGLTIPQSLLDQIAQKEQDVLNNKIVPAVKDAVTPIIEGLHTDVMLVVEHRQGKPLEVRVVKKRMADVSSNVVPEQRSSVSSSNVTPTAGRANIRRIVGTKGPNTGLCVTLPNGDYIQERYAAETLAEAIKLAGPQRVASLGLYMDGENFVSKTKHPVYASSQYDVSNGYKVNTHSNTAKKKEQLDKISKALKLGWKVKVIE